MVPVRKVDWAAQVTAGEDGGERCLRALLPHGPEVRHVGQELRGEADDVEDQEGVGPPVSWAVSVPGSGALMAVP